jgi:hypothetical protein
MFECTGKGKSYIPNVHQISSGTGKFYSFPPKKRRKNAFFSSSIGQISAMDAICHGKYQERLCVSRKRHIFKFENMDYLFVFDSSHSDHRRNKK